VSLPKRLRLPLVLTTVVLGSAAATMACLPDEEEGYFCVSQEPVADAGPTSPDAAKCDGIVHDPNDCPPGCIAEPLG
jgi:hypothetical protein